MKTLKTLIIFASFLIMITIIIDAYFLFDLDKPNKNIGAYVGVAAIIVMMIAVVFISVTERHIRKLKRKLEEKDQTINHLQSSLDYRTSNANKTAKKDSFF